MTPAFSRSGAAVRVGAAVGPACLLGAWCLTAVTATRADNAPTPPARVPWTTSRVVGSPEPPPPFKTVNAFPNVKLDHPLLIASAPGSDRLFVAEQHHRIVSFHNRPDAKPDVFFEPRKELKTVNRTPGAHDFESTYGLAFHPKFAENRLCYVCYTVRGKGTANLENGSRVSRFRVTDAEPPRVDPDSEEILLTFLQGGHNGGDLHFGPDGFLYISTGDAAAPNPPDPLHTGQDITDLLSSVLRIDVDRRDPGKTYAVPPDNPFVGLKVGDQPARPEVWAYGFRNPWRMSFDRSTGDLWVGDVGWELWEMVHKVEKGGNYGWSIVEARQSIHPADKPGPTPVRPPVIELPHSAAASITGGYVYRGKKFPELVGAYVFGDWETRRLWAARVDGTRVRSMPEIATPSLRIVAFGEDQGGELFIADYDAGTVHALARNDAAAFDPADFPRKLSHTGLFASTPDHAPVAGVTKFEINAKQWQDYAAAEHFVALPGATAVTDYENKKPLPGNVDWHTFRYHFPKNAVLAKTIFLDMERGNPASRKRVETQLLHFDGENWRGYTYAWRDDQSDADLVPADGAEKLFTVLDPVYGGGKREQMWSYHSRSQCLQCHNAWAEYALGFNPEQLNRGDQLAKLGERGLVNRIGKDDKPKPPYTADEAKNLPRLTDPHSPKAPVVDRAHAYLHANCGHCHRNGGGGAVDFELQAFGNWANPNLIDGRPTRGTFDLPDARVVAPGDPARSVLYFRTAKFGRGRMPHLGSELVDEAGVTLIGDWIRSLKPAPGHVPLDPMKVSPGDVAERLQSVAKAHDLAVMVGSPSCPKDTRHRILTAAAKLPEGNVRDLFEGYLTHAGQERKLGPSPRPQAILARQGNPDRGKELFWSQKMQCQTCHKVDGKGTDLGPDLSAIGKTRPRPDLLESLLEPSRRIDSPYQPYLLRTHDGRSFTGLLVRKDAKEVVLKDGQNKEVRVAADDIESFQPARESLMPSGVLADLTAQQAADLVEFLANRK